jgi:hypothetical protein
MKRTKEWFVTPADKCWVRVCIHYKNGKHVASHIAAFIMCAYICGTNRAEVQKTPVTLRDSTNVW